MELSTLSVDFKTLVAKMPSEWRGLISAMCKPGGQLLSAERWYEQNKLSVYGVTGSWQQLLCYFSEKEPLVSTETLPFAPRIRVFPHHLQSLLLAFIHHHRWDIPADSLKTFVNQLIPIQTWGCWSRVMVTMLKSHVGGDFITHEFDEKNKATLSRIVELLSSQENGFDVTLKGKSSSHQKKDANLSVHELMCIDSPVEAAVAVLSQPGEETTQPVTSQSVVQEEMDDDNIPSGAVLPEQMMNDAVHLKEAWLSDTRSADHLEQMTLFTSSTASQMEEICKCLDVLNFGDEAFHRACQSLSQVMIDMSATSRAVVCEWLVLRKLESLDRAVSRSLFSSITLLMHSCAPQMAESVLLPLTLHHNGPHQSDVVVKLVKEGMKSDHQARLLRLLCEKLDTIREHMFPLLQLLIDGKLDLEPAVLSRFISVLEASSSNHTKIVKFGKLLVAVINCFGSQMTQEQAMHMKYVVDQHNSFMKKTAISKLTTFLPK